MFVGSGNIASTLAVKFESLANDRCLMMNRKSRRRHEVRFVKVEAEAGSFEEHGQLVYGVEEAVMRPS